jgi:hypothetical protein
MLSDARWQVENKIMSEFFPWLKPFVTASGNVGFFGYLRGPRSRRLFQVLTKIPVRRFPEEEPPLYIAPKLTTEWFRPDDVNHRPEGRLCYNRLKEGRRVETRWQPAKNTFANVIGFAVQYLEEFDE